MKTQLPNWKAQLQEWEPQLVKWGLQIIMFCLLLVVASTFASNRTTDGASANGAEGEHAKELEEALVRTWFLARTQKDDLTVRTDDDLGFSLRMKEDGEASMSHMNGPDFISSTKTTKFLRWAATSFDDITFYKKTYKHKHTQYYNSFSAVYHPDTKELWVDASEWGVEGATFCFADGPSFEYSGYKRICDVETSKIEYSQAIIGEWSLSNVVDETTVTSGKGDEIAKWKGYKSGTMTLSEGGKGTFLGEDVEWSVNDGVGSMSILSGDKVLTFEKTPNNGIMVKDEVPKYTFEPVAS